MLVPTMKGCAQEEKLKAQTLAACTNCTKRGRESDRGHRELWRCTEITAW
jgi:hypothetical protein